MSHSNLGLLLGDPSGIGPELCAKLLEERSVGEPNRVVLIGEPDLFETGKKVAGVDLEAPVVEHIREIPEGRIGMLEGPELQMDVVSVGEASETCGRYALDSFRRASALCKSGELDGFCFAPMNKKSLHLGGNTHEDDLRFVAEELDHQGYCCELNTTKNLWTTRVTSHIPLKDVAGLITEEGIVDAVKMAHHTLLDTGLSHPRIGVAALNPHAGDGGNFGTEEGDIIVPAVKRVQEEGIDALGPYPADTVFVRAQKGDFDAVVTMYHDQGQIAMKLMGFDHGVTVLGGLPVPVTTPAHGTAFDIAGKGKANPDALKAAWKVLQNMVSSRLAS
ncbi:MAG: 4-hydroxythreonine-4-phosphate dehydrogenase PdxA [SAR324 cluster bacterium]|nr:4-hydroxythreonine-4-phosphate dehydrogenase PdxA [SAR324 cluster bacterium]